MKCMYVCTYIYYERMYMCIYIYIRCIYSHTHTHTYLQITAFLSLLAVRLKLPTGVSTMPVVNTDR
jgi:hypothetical protein